MLARHFVQYGRHGSDDRDAEYGRLRARREITAGVEHVLGDLAGEWVQLSDLVRMTTGK